MENIIEQFIQGLDEKCKVKFLNLNTPVLIQSYLDSIPYSAEDANRCPARVLQDGQAHCLDGVLLAAAALWQNGNPPIVVDLIPQKGRDDDHLLAIFKRNGRFGAIAKSNYVGLRFREAVYRSIRELVMSYFEVFFNVEGQKTLRAYSVPLNLQKFASGSWLWSDESADLIEHHLVKLRHFPLISTEMIAELSPLDQRSYQAGMLGSDPAGLYQPKS